MLPANIGMVIAKMWVFSTDVVKHQDSEHSGD
jgi:hypothetical protein